MSATTLARLAAHIDKHELPWVNISPSIGFLEVQLSGRSEPEVFARWAASLSGVRWAASDWRATDERFPNATIGWRVAAFGDLDGDVHVWTVVPVDLGDTAEEVVDRMVKLADSLAASSA